MAMQMVHCFVSLTAAPWTMSLNASGAIALQKEASKTWCMVWQRCESQRTHHGGVCGLRRFEGWEGLRVEWSSNFSIFFCKFRENLDLIVAYPARSFKFPIWAESDVSCCLPEDFPQISKHVIVLSWGKPEIKFGSKPKA